MIYPYWIQIVFEAVRGGGYKGDIALDDITITDSNCAGQHVSCRNLHWNQPPNPRPHLHRSPPPPHFLFSFGYCVVIKLKNPLVHKFEKNYFLIKK
jgi:hypothetical protein